MGDLFVFDGDPITPLINEVERIAAANPTALPDGTVYVPPRGTEPVAQLSMDDPFGTEENQQTAAQRGLAY